MIDLIELVISFSSFGKQRPQQTIKNYMHEVLKYPLSKPLISPIVSFQHLYFLFIYSGISLNDHLRITPSHGHAYFSGRDGSKQDTILSLPVPEIRHTLPLVVEEINTK